MTNTSWIEWDGGSCPVPESTLVEVKFRDGVTSGAHCADYWNWHWQPYNSKYDIVAYRFPEPPMTDDLDDELKRLRDQLSAELAAGKTDIDFSKLFAKLDPISMEMGKRILTDDLDDEEKRRRDQLSAELAAGKTDIDYAKYFVNVFVNVDPISMEMGKRMLDAFLAKRAEKKKKKNPPPGSNQ